MTFHSLHFAYRNLTLWCFIDELLVINHCYWPKLYDRIVSLEYVSSIIQFPLTSINIYAFQITQFSFDANGTIKLILKLSWTSIGKSFCFEFWRVSFFRETGPSDCSFTGIRQLRIDPISAKSHWEIIKVKRKTELIDLNRNMFLLHINQSKNESCVCDVTSEDNKYQKTIY